MELITYNEDMTGPSSSQTVRDSVIRQIRYGIASSPTAQFPLHHGGHGGFPLSRGQR